MRRTRTTGPLLAIVWVICTAGSAAAQESESYTITRVSDTATEESNGSSSSSHDEDTLVAHVVSRSAEGTEIEYDLPRSTSDDDRARGWQFPARVLKAADGGLQLLNEAEVETRLNVWLSRNSIDRAACGSWIFTWNAFKIECDPKSVLDTLRVFEPDLPELREGALYTDPNALAAVPLAAESWEKGVATFSARPSLDVEALRRERARSDVVLGEIMHSPVSLESALKKRAEEQISGTIDVTIEADADWNLRALRRVQKSRTIQPDGVTVTETTTQSIEHSPLGGADRE